MPFATVLHSVSYAGVWTGQARLSLADFLRKAITPLTAVSRVIEQAAREQKLDVRVVTLHGQFRCGGSKAYEGWVLNLLGLGDEANQGMKLMLQRYQNYPNGMTNNTNGVFEYLGVHLAAMNESLLQSYNGKIRVFPALPSDTSLVTRFTLAATGGFLVTSEREGGDIKYVGLASALGNTATVINPWATGAAQVRRVDVATTTPLMTASTASLTFPTVAGGVYVLERVAKPLSSYTFSFLTGSANQGAKTLSTNTSLGLGAPP